ncbi:hypothetical protein AB0H00_09475 [Nocardia sp. NPDC023852]|uniref:hypothetical protein n=1 Tax=Nocardia sp. NPDC023852 TaxID=3154697 RepID=UPI003401ECDC
MGNKFGADAIGVELYMNRHFGDFCAGIALAGSSVAETHGSRTCAACLADSV